MPHKFIIPAPQPRICLVSVRDHICGFPFCLCLRSFDLCPTAPLHIPPAASIRRSLRCRLPALVIPRRLILSLLDLSPGARPRYAAYTFFREPFKISGFYDQGQRRMGLDPQKTAQFLYFLLISFLRRQFSIRLSNRSIFCGLLVMGCHVLIQRLPI